MGPSSTELLISSIPCCGNTKCCCQAICSTVSQVHSQAHDGSLGNQSALKPQDSSLMSLPRCCTKAFCDTPCARSSSPLFCHLMEHTLGRRNMPTCSLSIAPEELNDAQDEEHVTVEALHCNFLEGAVCVKWIHPASAACIISHLSMQAFPGHSDAVTLLFFKRSGEIFAYSSQSLNISVKRTRMSPTSCTHVNAAHLTVFCSNDRTGFPESD